MSFTNRFQLVSQGIIIALACVMGWFSLWTEPQHWVLVAVITTLLATISLYISELLLIFGQKSQRARKMIPLSTMWTAFVLIAAMLKLTHSGHAIR